MINQAGDSLYDNFHLEMASHQRLKGFYPAYVDSVDDADRLFRATSEKASNASPEKRVCINFIGSLAVLGEIIEAESEFSVEAAVPFRNQKDAAYFFAARSPTDRQVNPEDAQRHKATISSLSKDCERSAHTSPSYTNPKARFEFNTADDFLSDSDKFTRLASHYMEIGYTQKSLSRILKSTDTIVGTALVGENIVSSSMAHKNRHSLKNEEFVSIELARALTVNHYRGAGVYRELSRLMLNELGDFFDLGVNQTAVYAESNLSAEGVLRVAIGNGRRFCIQDADQLGAHNYNYGILSKHFAAQSLEYGPYNDYLVSYYE